MKPRTPIDNCPHDQVEYDEVVDEEYCVACGYIFKQDPGGWIDVNNS